MWSAPMNTSCPPWTRSWPALTDAYMEETFSQAFKAGQLLRPIPVNRSVAVEYQVATHEDSRQILRNQRLIAVAECICRKQQGLLDKGCGKPREVCMVFGAHAEYYIERKHGPGDHTGGGGRHHRDGRESRSGLPAVQFHQSRRHVQLLRRLPAGCCEPSTNCLNRLTL